MFERQRLSEVLRRLGVDAGELFDALDRAYGEPSRHYHNRLHISECLTALDTFVAHADRPVGLRRSAEPLVTGANVAVIPIDRPGVFRGALFLERPSAGNLFTAPEITELEQLIAELSEL